MKKRIISFILVVAMAVLALVGCGYSYESDDLTKYATFDMEKFTKALLGEDGTLIRVDDGSFGIDQAVRLDKVQDQIFTTLGTKADVNDKITEGTLGKYDILYYSYYVSATVKDGDKEVEHIFYASNKLAEASATKLQLGFSEYKAELDEKISDALLNAKVDDFIYKTDLTGAVTGGDVIYVSYTKSVPQFNEDGTKKLDAEGKHLYKDETVAYIPLTVDKAPDDGVTGNDRSFTQQLLSKKPGKVSGTITTKEEYNGAKYNITYSNVNVHWIVDNMKEIASVTDTTYTSTTKVKAENGTSYDLKDVELTYHIFPVYFLDVEAAIDEYDVIKTLLGSLTMPDDANDDGKIDEDEQGSFSFLGEDLKNGEETVKAIAEKLNELLKTWQEKVKATADAKKTLDDKQKVVDEKGDNATTAQKDALKNAKEAYDKAVKAEEDAEKAVDDQIVKLLGCGGDIEDKIVEEYTQSVYDDLEDKYEKELSKNISVKVFELAKKYITYKTEDGKPVLPWDSVHDMYNRSIEMYKYDFYTGNYSSATSTSAAVSNYDKYNGDFNAFLRIEVGLKADADMQKVYDIIGAEAEQNAKDLILVYTLYKAYGAEVALTDEDKASAENMFNIYTMIYGKDYASVQDFYDAEVLNNIMDYLLTIKEREEDNTDLTVKFEHLNYTTEKLESEDK